MADVNDPKRLVERLRHWETVMREAGLLPYAQIELLRSAECIETLLRAAREVISQIDQGGSEGKVFARDNCIERLRALIQAGPE